MGNKLVDTSKLETGSLDEFTINTNDKLNSDIAIIGMSGKFASAENIDEYWKILKNGVDCIRTVPEKRKEHLEACTNLNELLKNGCTFDVFGYLDEIDTFDYEFFSISPIEAKYMDPNQKIFLQTVWNTFEDAGYSGSRIVGSRTGVYVGHSTDFGSVYKHLLDESESLMDGVSITGSIKSIIGSRISYLLDLKGPSMLIDTACSSSLVAVHLACQAIKNGECDMAIAGGIKLMINPLVKDTKDSMGIRSASNITRAFDDSADGTGFGEGSCAILLKPLCKAQSDGDNIYAVIKGSAVNQDGNSIGLTAPNSAAQEEVIVKAWKNAGINPETITYIEAHGTGTKLGDPIEISGLQRAFSKYTSKKQFCAISSVKTNIGHLDHASGIAGLTKAVLALRNKQIPASLHFKNPNRNINFELSPIYVNDRLANWEVNGYPRRCGINSFGLSGTNCHVVLEEAPEKDLKKSIAITQAKHVLALSAKNEDSLIQLLNSYYSFLKDNNQLVLEDVCYTTNTGRGHYNNRIIMTAASIEDLGEKLSYICSNGLKTTEALGIFHSVFKIVEKDKGTAEKYEITVENRKNISSSINEKIKQAMKNKLSISESIIEEICKSYIAGADIEWKAIYLHKQYRIVSLPVYPFAKVKCFTKLADGSSMNSNNQDSVLEHPLLKKCLAVSFDRITYLSELSIKDHWVISEHKINGLFVVPGTTYIEMVREIIKKHFLAKTIELKEIIFITPMIVTENEVKEVQTIIKLEENVNKFVISSRTGLDDLWVIHAEGMFNTYNTDKIPEYDVLTIKSRCGEKNVLTYSYKQSSGVETGPRWNNMKSIDIGKDECLGYFELPIDYQQDCSYYDFHPALLDNAVNMGIRTIGEDLYLPWVYKSFKIFGEMPSRFYCYLRRKDMSNKEAASFDIALINEDGKAFAEINNYTVKSVKEPDIQMKRTQEKQNCYYEIGWKHIGKSENINSFENEKCLILKGETKLSDDLFQAIKLNCKELTEVELGEGSYKINDTKYIIGKDEESYNWLSEIIKEKEITKVIHLLSLTKSIELVDDAEFDSIQTKGVYSMFYLTKALANCNFGRKIEILVVTDYADEVTKLEDIIKPNNSELIGLARVINKEFTYIKCRCIDIDNYISVESIINEMLSTENIDKVIYRNGNRYIEELRQTDIGKLENKDFEIKQSGVYVLTGGLGGIGLEVCKYLAAKGKVNIALINRTKLPERENWDKILDEDKEARISKKIRTIREIEAKGASITIYSADTSLYADMEDVFNDLRKKYGSINGIIHGAGVAGDGFLARKTHSVFRNVIEPKTKGTWVLDKLTSNDNLDFFIMCSSISSFICEAGQGDYTAANSYLDAFSAYRLKKGKPAITINWPAWKEIGMAVEYGVNNDGVFKAISTLKALNLLDSVINKCIGRIVLGELNHEEYSSMLNSELPFEISEGLKRHLKRRSNISSLVTKAGAITNVILQGREDEKGYTNTEKLIAQVWGKLLGYSEINILDNFFNLGGNSLIAVKYEIEMERNGIPLQYSIIYQYPSVSELAAYIDNNESTKHPIIETKIEGKQVKQKYQNSSNEINEIEKANDQSDKKAGGCIEILGIKPFNEIVYKGCFNSMLFPVLKYYNKSILPIMLNDEISYVCNKEVNELSILYVPNSDINQVVKNLGIDVKTKLYTENIINNLMNSIINEKPVIIAIDCFYESIREDTFNKLHWPHSLLVYGYNEEDETFNIIEQRNRESLIYEKRKISFSDIANSYNGYISNYKNLDITNSSFNQLTYHEGKESLTYFEFYMDKQKHIDNPVDDYKYTFSTNLNKNKEKILNNITFFDTFIPDFKNILLDESMLNEKAKDMVNILNSIISAKQAERYKVENVFNGENESVNILDEIIEAWSYIRSRIVKYLYTQTYKKNEFITSIGILEQVKISEYKYYNYISALLESLQ